MAYATHAELVEAIKRHNFSHLGHEASNEELCGTYHIEPTWIGSHRVWMASRITEHVGYEVAYQEFFKGSSLNDVITEDRIGFWVNDEGVEFLDRTIHIDASAGVALDIGRLYSQEAVWSWDLELAIPCSDPASALTIELSDDDLVDY